eukprot:Gb_36834 [translate_table: standard]
MPFSIPHFPRQPASALTQLLQWKDGYHSVVMLPYQEIHQNCYGSL